MFKKHQKYFLIIKLIVFLGNLLNKKYINTVLTFKKALVFNFPNEMNFYLKTDFLTTSDHYI